ncbi:MAG: NADH-quinone oxidoreductase subunit N [Desulforhopalus sp.]
MTLDDIRIALPLLTLAIGALLTLIYGAATRSQTSGFVISTAAAAGAGLLAVAEPAILTAPTLGLSGSVLARLFTAYFCFMSVAVLLLSFKYNQHHSISGEECPATIVFATFGMVALASAANLLIVFLGLEAMTFAFYFLVAINRRNLLSGEAALKYLLMGAVSAAFLAFGIALIYCHAGTLAIGKAIALASPRDSADALALAGWGFVFTGVAFKLSLVPAHLWTPDVYDAAPAPVVAFLSSGSKAAAVLFLLLLLPHAGGLQAVRLPLFVAALLSMMVGSLAALRQNRVRRMLAYSSIAHMGYAMVALLSYKGGGFQAAAYYGIAYGIMSLAAFGAIGVLENNGCSASLDDYRGRGYTHPFAAAVLTVALFAQAGIPPSIGFTGKFLIFAAALRAGEITLAIVGIITAAVSIYYYLRLVTVLYLHRREDAGGETIGLPETVVLGLSTVLIILLGIFPQHLLALLRMPF